VPNGLRTDFSVFLPVFAFRTQDTPGEWSVTGQLWLMISHNHATPVALPGLITGMCESCDKNCLAGAGQFGLRHPRMEAVERNPQRSTNLSWCDPATWALVEVLGPEHDPNAHVSWGIPVLHQCGRGEGIR
jgi:hypothetical protein